MTSFVHCHCHPFGVILRHTCFSDRILTLLSDSLVGTSSGCCDVYYLGYSKNLWMELNLRLISVDCTLNIFSFSCLLGRQFTNCCITDAALSCSIFISGTANTWFHGLVKIVIGQVKDVSMSCWCSQLTSVFMGQMISLCQTASESANSTIIREQK